MSITTETTRLAFIGDGSDNSPYAISFPLRDKDSVEMFFVTDSTGAEADKVRVTDYNITLAADFVTATLDLVTTAPATGETMVIRSNEPMTRLSDYSNFDGQPSATTNSDYDKGTMKDRTLQEQLDRAVLVSKGHPNANLPLTPLVLKGNAGKTIVVNSGETDFELLTDSIADGTITPAKLLDGSADNQVIQYNSGLGEWEYRVNLTVPGTLAVTGVLTISDGNAAAPGIRTTTSVHGMFEKDASTLGFSVAGTEQLTIGGTTVVIPLDGLVISAGNFTVTVGAATIGGTLASGALTVTGGITATTTIAATGIVTGATGSLFGNLTLADGSITDSSGAISFGNENLSTTGTFTANGITSTGNLTVQGTALSLNSATVAAVNSLSVSNTDGTNSASDARVQITTQSAAGGDPFIEWVIGAAQIYVMGIDNSDSDKLVGSVGAALGTSNWLEVTTAGVVTLPGTLASGALTVTGAAIVTTTITAGSSSTVLTTAAGLLRHQAIDPAIAGAGLTATTGVLSVDAHTIASHSDTTATGAELNTLTGAGNADALHVHTIVALDTTATGANLTSLTDNSVADTLHRHSELVASDGSPDPVVSVDAAGTQVTIGQAAAVRGHILLEDGSGGNTAGFITLTSRNGTVRTLWIEDDGTLKIHTKAPVDNADGDVVGAQT
jgi:hypothetical protein